MKTTDTLVRETLFRAVAFFGTCILASAGLTTCDLFKAGLGNKVDINPPEISITSPANNAYVKGDLVVSGTVSDDLGVASVSVVIDGTSHVAAVTNGTWSVTIPVAKASPAVAGGIAEGKKTVSAVTVDEAGKQRSVSIDVNIDNTAPTVMVTSPTTFGLSSTDCPQNTTYIDIKGEAYDPSPIASVVVKLLKLDKTLLDSATADGTNTWSVRFLLKGSLASLVDNASYYYDVAVTDKTGNVSDYYYHSYDIYSLIASGALFPPMDEIGQLDQAGEGTSSSGIEMDALKAKRLGPTSTRADIAYANFKYMEDAVPTISFSNLDAGKPQNENLLGLNAVVTGNIVPPANGGAIEASSITVDIYSPSTAATPLTTITNSNANKDNLSLVSLGDSMSFTVEMKNGASDLPQGGYKMIVRAKAQGSDEGIQPVMFYIDSGAPTVNETLVGIGSPFRNAPFRLGSPAADALYSSLGLDNLKIYQSFESGADALVQTISLGGTTSTSWQSDFMPTPAADGSYNYTIVLTTSSSKTANVYRSVTYDTTPPAVEIPSFSSYASGIKVNGVVTFSAISADANGIDGTNYFVTTTNVAPAYDAAVGSPATVVQVLATKSIDTSTLTDGGTYYLWAVARDKAGNEAANSVVQSFEVDQSTDRPVVSFSDISAAISLEADAGSNLITLGGKITGTVTDDDGLASQATLHIDLDKDGSFEAGAETVALPLSGSGRSKTFSYDPSAFADGAYRFYIDVADSNPTPVHNASMTPIWFAYDTADPTITFAANADDAQPVGPYRRADFAVSGTVEDASGIAKVEFSFDNGSTWQDLGVTAAAGATAPWTRAIAAASNNGAKNLVARATDTFGRSKIAGPVAVTIDTVGPTGAIAAFASGYYADTQLAVSGTAADALSGVLKAEYSTTSSSGPWSPLTGTVSWFKNDIDASAFPEGTASVWLKVTDNAGNESAVYSDTFVVDHYAPTLVVDAAFDSAVYKNSEFAINGTVADTNLGASPISIAATKGASAHALTNPIVYDSGPDPDTWSRLINIDGTGSYEITITATDGVGRQTVAKRTVIVDITPPTATADAVAGYVSGTVPISGLAADVGSEVASVQYQLNGTAGAWTDASGTVSWRGSLDLSSAAETAQTLYVRALDKAGNYSSSYATTTINVDRANPRASMSGTGALIQSNADIVFTGTADDAAITSMRAAASATITWSKDGGTETVVPLTIDLDGADDAPGTADDGSFSWTLPISGGDGLYAIKLTVTDVALKTATVSRTAQIDTTPPTLAVAAPVNGESTSSSIYAISGTSRDTGGSGFDGTDDVDYKLDAGTWAALTLSGISWGKSDVDLGSSEGTHQLWFRSTDRLGNQSAIGPITLYYDLAPPSLAETTVGTTDTQYRNANLVFGGTASDTNALANLKVAVDGGAATPITVNGDASWSYEADVDTDGAGAGDVTGLAEGTHTLVFTATDIAGKTASLTRTILVDTEKPTLYDITDLSVGWKQNESNAVAGSASDTGSGIAKVEYRIDAGSWNLMSGTASFSGTIAISAGVHTLEIRAVDKTGNESAYNTQPVRIDTVNPLIAVTSPASLVKLNGSADLSAAVNGSDADSGVAAIAFKLGSSDFTSPDATATLDSGNANNGTWLATLPKAAIAALAEGQRQVYVRATDASGRTSVTSFPIFIDITPPKVSFASHSDGAVLNKQTALFGYASDEQSLSTVVVQIYNALTSDWDNLVSSGTFSWSVLASNFDTDALDSVDANSDTKPDYDADTGTAGVQFLVRAVAADEAGNIAVESRTFTIDQDSDRPVIKLTNLSPAGGTTLKLSRTVFGSVSDDDGAVSKLEISENGVFSDDASDDISLDGGTWQRDASSGDGEKRLYFRITDATGAVFATDAALEPRVQNGASYWETYVAYRVDTVTPEIGSTITVDRAAPFDFDADSNTVALTTNMPFGGAYAQFEVRAEATDANGIASVTVTVPGAAGSPFVASASGDIFTTGPIDVGAVADGSLVVTVEAIDNSGLKSTATRTILVDNTAPTVTHQTPLVTEVVNGEISVKGLASDGLGSGLKSIQYKVGYNYAGESWQSAGGTLFNWQIDFTGANKIDIYAVAGEATDGDSDGIWDLPILIRAEDNAGNVYTSTAGTYVLKVDPSGDKPKATIVYPDPAETNRTLGGIIRIFGTASDDDGVKAVYMQIDVDNDGDCDASDVADGTDWYNGGSGQLVSGTVSWNKSINTSGEFNPPGEGTRRIWFRVRARDINDLDGGWSSWNAIDVDKNVPKIGSTTALSLYQASTSTSRIYVADMWVKGDWVLNGSVEDESDISSILVSGDINGSLAANPAWFTRIANGYELNIPLNTVAGSSGNISFTVKAYDNNSPIMENTANFSVNYDNKAPVLGAYTGNTPVVQSNKTYTLVASVNEDGAGFERVAFYFLRQGATNAYDRVYNPMEARTGDANRTYLSDLTMVDGLPRLSLSGVTRANDYSLSHASLVGNRNVRKGGLVKIGGLDRLITAVDYDAGTIQWADAISTSVTDAWPAYALVVDNLKVETPVWSGDTLSSITNDDGDMLIESVERSGGLYSWTSSVDSRNIPDGPIEIHYVAFDKAGNYVEDFVSTSVQNNRPLLAKATLGTDLTGDGDTLDPGEQVAPYSALDGSGNRQAEATLASGAFVARGYSTIDIDVLCGNGKLQYVLSLAGADGTFGTADDVVVHPLTDLRADESSAIQQIAITEAQLLAPTIGDGSRTFLFTIWDSTEETTTGVDSQWAKLTMPITVDVVDEVAPKDVISPFYWHSASDNSLYQNSKSYGHIEEPGVYNGTDPDVSGIVSIRGTAYDDQRITAIWAMIDDFSFANASSLPAKVVGGNTYTRVAAYSGGSWSGNDELTANGWKASASDVSIDQSGHRVAWQLDWNSAKTTGVTAVDQSIRILVDDKGRNGTADSRGSTTTLTDDAFDGATDLVGKTIMVGSTVTYVSAFDDGTDTVTLGSAISTGEIAYSIYNSASTSLSADPDTEPDTVKNVPYYMVDVVPYISSIVRSTSANRSRLGKYPLRDSESDVTVNGFNLLTSTTQDANNWIRIYSAASGGNYDTDALTVEAAPAPSVDLFQMTMSANSNSGYFRLAVNGIEAINNIDDNAAEWNKEVSAADASATAAWNDDRYLMLFRTGDYFANSLDPEYASMSFDAVNGRLVGEWSNSGYAATYYGTPVADGNSRTELFSTYDPPTWTDVLVDADGQIHSVILEDYNNGGTTWGYLASYRGTGSRVSIESLGDDNPDTPNYTDGRDEKLHQFRNARIAVRSATNDQYVSYYDYFSKCLKYGRMTNGAQTFVAENGHRTDSATVVDGVDDFSVTTTDPDVGSMSDIAIDDIGGTDATSWRPVIVYYDATNERLKIARGNSSQPSGTTQWTIRNVTNGDADDDDGAADGHYLGYGSLSMKIDASGNLHIATRDSMNGGLYYIFAANIDGTETYAFSTPVLVDSTTADGAWCDIALNGSSPLISYKNGTSYNGLKYAYVATGTGLSSSDWEYMTVPASTAVNDGRTNIEYAVSATDFPYDGNVAFSYVANYFQIIYLRRQVP